MSWAFSDSDDFVKFLVKGITPQEAMFFYERIETTVPHQKVKIKARLTEMTLEATLAYIDVNNLQGCGIHFFALACCEAAGGIMLRRGTRQCVPHAAVAYDFKLVWQQLGSGALSSDDEVEQEIDLSDFKVLEDALERELALWSELRRAYRLLRIALAS